MSTAIKEKLLRHIVYFPYFFISHFAGHQIISIVRKQEESKLIRSDMGMWECAFPAPFFFGPGFSVHFIYMRRKHERESRQTEAFHVRYINKNLFYQSECVINLTFFILNLLSNGSLSFLSRCAKCYHWKHWGRKNLAAMGGVQFRKRWWAAAIDCLVFCIRIHAINGNSPNTTARVEPDLQRNVKLSFWVNYLRLLDILVCVRGEMGNALPPQHNLVWI